jgi:hypothetical protein
MSQEGAVGSAYIYTRVFHFRAAALGFRSIDWRCLFPLKASFYVFYIKKKGNPPPSVWTRSVVLLLVLDCRKETASGVTDAIAVCPPTFRTLVAPGLVFSLGLALLIQKFVTHYDASALLFTKEHAPFVGRICKNRSGQTESEAAVESRRIQRHHIVL